MTTIDRSNGRTKRRLLKALAAATAPALGVVLMAGPASAAQTCTYKAEYNACLSIYRLSTGQYRVHIGIDPTIWGSGLNKWSNNWGALPDRHRGVTTEPGTLGLPSYRTVSVDESRLHGYRRLYHASVLRMSRGTRDQDAVFAFWRQTLGPRAFWTSWALSWPGSYELYRRRQLRTIGEPEHLQSLLDEEEPDVILHPTVLEGLANATLTDSLGG